MVFGRRIIISQLDEKVRGRNIAKKSAKFFQKLDDQIKNKNID